jgi:uncharacterized NAD(P)/FAD-binding protein YdhS
MQATGQFIIIAGSITDLIPEGDAIDVYYRKRGSHLQQYRPASFVINCTGPEPDYNKIKDILVKNLIRRGLIQPDPVKLGINALPDGSIIQRDGKISEVLYTIGLPLRGVLWETLAAPEIRIQAAGLAGIMLK